MNERVARTWPQLLPGILALLASVGSLPNGFVYDDVPIILENPLIHELGSWSRIWQHGYWPGGALYRPLTMQCFALEWWLGGGRPVVFHAVNVVLAVVSAILVFRLARRLLPPPGALAAACLFAVHPAHVEAVANVVGQSELIATLFCLIAAERYLAWRRDGALGTSRRVALGVFFLAAVSAKESGFALPALLALLELTVVGGPGRLRDRHREALPAFATLAGVAVIALLLRLILLGGLAGDVPAVPIAALTPAERGIAMLAVVPEWARLLFWPARLQADYGPPGTPISTSLTTAHFAGVALLIAAVLLAAWCRHRVPAVTLGVLWIAAALFPVSNLLLPTGIILAERTLLLASVGAVLLPGALVGRLVPETPGNLSAREGAAALVVGILLTLGLTRSIERQSIWRAQDAFYDQLTLDAPRSYHAYLVQAIYLSQVRELAAAEASARAALALYPRDVRVHETLGQVLRREGRCGDAIPVLAAGVALDPARTVVRSRLIECGLVVGDTAMAVSVAESGIREGSSEFESVLRRIRQRHGR